MLQVNIPDCCMHRMICVDGHTRSLLKNLLPDDKNLTRTERVNLRYLYLDLLKLSNWSLSHIFQGIRGNSYRRLKLRHFLTLADYFKWDIERNINIVFFYPSFRRGLLRRRMKALGFSSYAVAEYISAAPTAIQASTKIRYDSTSSIEIFARVFKFITEREREYYTARPDAKIKNYDQMLKYDGEEVYI